MVQTMGTEKREIQPLTKRGAVPACSGFLSCPNVDGQIGEDNTDNDIYSDCEWHDHILHHITILILIDPGNV